MPNICIDMGRDVLCKKRGSESKEKVSEILYTPASYITHISPHLRCLERGEALLSNGSSNANKEYHNKRV